MLSKCNFVVVAVFSQFKILKHDDMCRGVSLIKFCTLFTSLNVVTSVPLFFSPLLVLSSPSSNVLTVLVEFPSTKPNDETAAFWWR